MPRNDSMRKEGRTWNCRVADIDQDAGSLNHKEPQNDPNLPALSPLLGSSTLELPEHERDEKISYFLAFIASVAWS